MNFIKKTNNKSIGFIVVLIAILLSSCNKDDDQGITPLASENPVILMTQVQSGSWTVSKMIDSGNDETIHFQSFVFKFNSNGIVEATNGDVAYSGNWSITSNNSQDDSPNDLDFNIYFNLTNKFEELNDDWDVLSSSSNKIELIDVSSGNGGVDYLTFVKS